MEAGGRAVENSPQNVPNRVISAWAAQDADAFAEIFEANGTMVLPGVYLNGREKIRSFLKSAFAGPFKGTRVVGRPVHVNQLSDTVTVLVSEGGVIAAGQDELAPESTIMATWVVTRVDGEWLISAYQNTPKH
jgi:uncharacterized protein (TIGR02246 family)